VAASARTRPGRVRREEQSRRAPDSAPLRPKRTHHRHLSVSNTQGASPSAPWVRSSESVSAAPRAASRPTFFRTGRGVGELSGHGAPSRGHKHDPATGLSRIAPEPGARRRQAQRKHGRARAIRRARSTAHRQPARLTNPAQRRTTAVRAKARRAHRSGNRRSFGRPVRSRTHRRLRDGPRLHRRRVRPRAPGAAGGRADSTTAARGPTRTIARQMGSATHVATATTAHPSHNIADAERSAFAWSQSLSRLASSRSESERQQKPTRRATPTATLSRPAPREVVTPPA